MTKPQSLTAINGGINRLRVKGGSDPDSLYDLLNGYVTQSGTVKVRPGTFRNANIAQYSGAGNTKGLLAYQDEFHVFSANVVPVPPNYALHVLAYPYVSALSNNVVVTPPTTDPYWTDVVCYMTAPLAGDCASIGAPAFVIGSNVYGGTAPSTGLAPALYSGALALNTHGSNYFANSTSTTFCSFASFANYPSLNIFAASNNWTIECFFCLNGIGGNGYATLFDYGGIVGGPGSSDPTQFLITVGYNSSTSQYVANVANNGMFGAGAGSFGGNMPTVTTGTWHHIAVCCVNGVTSMYVDGGLLGTSAVNWNTTNYNNGNVNPAPSPVNGPGVVIGSNENLNYYTADVSISNVRITSGVARYTAAFTKPSAPFPQPTCIATSPPIKEIHFAAAYLGGIYVVAEFTGVPSALVAEYGTVFHYWVQSSTGGDNSNFWTANTDYLVGDVVIPTAPNGLTYIATRKGNANPLWQPNTLEAVGNIVEPNTANGFQYTVTAVLGSAPTTGATEPSWPTSDGATVLEDSSLANDQTVTLVTVSSNVATPPLAPSRYSGLYTAPNGNS